MKIGIAGNVSLWVSYGWRVDMIPIAVWKEKLYVGDVDAIIDGMEHAIRLGN
jgi:hypothetical protein